MKMDRRVQIKKHSTQTFLTVGQLVAKKHQSQRVNGTRTRTRPGRKPLLQLLALPRSRRRFFHQWDSVFRRNVKGEIRYRDQEAPPPPP